MTENEQADGRAHLCAADPVMAGIIARIGDCADRSVAEPFTALARAIVGQQISTKAADSIWNRFAELARGDVTPEAVAALAPEHLYSAGLSKSKAAYLADLAARFLDGTVAPESFPGMSDEEIIEHLVRVKGIGRWTAEMFLIFCLGRPDVLPVDDLGFQNAVQRAYGRETRPTRAELRALGERWQPYRSLATLYLWQSLRLTPLEEDGRTG